MPSVELGYERGARRVEDGVLPVAGDLGLFPGRDKRAVPKRSSLYKRHPVKSVFA